MAGNSCTELRCPFKSHAKDVKTIKLRHLVLDKDQNVSEDCLPSKKPPYIDSPPLPLPKQRKAHSFISTQTIEYNQPSPISESVEYGFTYPP